MMLTNRLCSILTLVFPFSHTIIWSLSNHSSPQVSMQHQRCLISIRGCFWLKQEKEFWSNNWALRCILDHFALFPLSLSLSLSLSFSLFLERFLTELANELLESTSSAKAPRAHGHYATRLMANLNTSLSPLSLSLSIYTSRTRTNNAESSCWREWAFCGSDEMSSSLTLAQESLQSAVKTPKGSSPVPEERSLIVRYIVSQASLWETLRLTARAPFAACELHHLWNHPATGMKCETTLSIIRHVINSDTIIGQDFEKKLY